MKRVITAVTLLLFATAISFAQLTFSGGAGETADRVITGSDGKDSAVSVPVSGIEIERSGDYLRIGLEMDLGGLKVRSDRAVLLTPHLVCGTDSLDLPTVGIYGRRLYYFHIRNSRGRAFSGGSEAGEGTADLSYMEGHRPSLIHYSRVVECPRTDGADTVELLLRRSEYGCCNILLAMGDTLLDSTTSGSSHQRAEQIQALAPEANGTEANVSGTDGTEAGPGTLERSLRGTARIEFRLDRTQIDASFRDNGAELAAISATIDSLKALGGIVGSVGDGPGAVAGTEGNGVAVRITRVELKGFASPEGRYGHNAELAAARVGALRDRLRQLYGFADDVISVSYEAEDWEGFRAKVLESDLEHRQEILRLIDGPDADPDVREWRIRTAYPEDYLRIVREIYPRLRRVDYEIRYLLIERDD